MSGVSDLLDEQGLDPESSGGMTLDPERALRLMARVQLPGPNHYLLKLVQAAVASGAPEVDCRAGWFSVEVDFVPPEPLFLEKLLHHLFVNGSEMLRCLAVGVNAALGSVKSVAIEQDGKRHLFTRDGCWEEVAPSRAGVHIRVARYRWDHTPELTLLRERCGWSPIPVRVNGKLVALQRWGSERTLVQSYVPGEATSAPGSSSARMPPRVAPDLAGGRVRCEMVLGLEPSGAGTLDFVQHGVLVCCRRFDVKGVVGVVGAEGLPTDLGGFELIDGPELRERIERVRGEVESMLRRVETSP